MDGASDRGLNHNNIDDLSTWLESYHDGHFLLWNLADHRDGGGHGSGGSDKKVSRKLYQRTSGQVLDVPWLSADRRCYVPSVRHLLRICYTIKVSAAQHSVLH